MIKYIDYATVFAEIPDEISLAIEITCCPNRCKGCHSPRLHEDIGFELTTEALSTLIGRYPGISCVAFMGGDNDHNTIAKLADFVKSKKLKVAMYSGQDTFDNDLAEHLDYYKIGSYQEELGPLNKETTNQRLFKLTPKLEDITYKFWPNK